MGYFYNYSFFFKENDRIFAAQKKIGEMKVFDKIVDLQNELFVLRKEGKNIGLVPTMGALHEGHTSLVRRSVAENDITIVSVFLNPTQFNDPNDRGRWMPTVCCWNRRVPIMSLLHPSARYIPCPTRVVLSFLPSAP